MSILFVCVAFIGRDQPRFENVPQEFRGNWEYIDNEASPPKKEKLEITENSYKSTGHEKEGDDWVKKNETAYSAS
ncbi:MAG: hypothetical protein LBH85_00325 [Treponema sp.]|nr:hypothetical protein [Treponema sp.]